MTDLAIALKSEISRLARKELKAQLEPLKRSAAQSKAQLAALREEVSALKRQIRLKKSRRDTWLTSLLQVKEHCDSASLPKASLRCVVAWDSPMRRWGGSLVRLTSPCASGKMAWQFRD